MQMEEIIDIHWHRCGHICKKRSSYPATVRRGKVKIKVFVLINWQCVDVYLLCSDDTNGSRQVYSAIKVLINAFI